MASIFGTNASETINASDGVTDGADTIWGFDGDDTIYGLFGDDTIYAGDDNDLIRGGAGADAINGGAGTDTANYSDSPLAVTVSLATGEGSGGTAEGDTLTNIENLTGSSQADLLTGNDSANVLSGSYGDDVVSGGGGADTLYGNGEHDTLKGGGGADTLDGGAGYDTANYADSATAVSVSLYTDSAEGGTAEGDELNSIENLTGSAHNDILLGDDSINVLRGNDGNDSFKGFGGADHLYGGDGNDTLQGMDGIDTIRGEDGVDTIYGGADRDLLYGGGGPDVFRWDDISETGVTLATADVIYDFKRLEGDEINLTAIDADVYAAGNQAFTFIGTAGFSGTPGEIRYYYSGGYTHIEMQTGTAVDVEGVITLAGIHYPEASWFLL